MKILEESNIDNAWCVSRRGRIIPVKVHPFGALDDDATEDAAWLYVVNDDYDKSEIIKYIANQMCYDYGIDNNWESSEIESIVSESLEDIESLKGMPSVKELIQKVYDYIAFIREGNALSELQTEALGKTIKNHLNENYLRARYGSEYQNRIERAGALYFRTSSSDGFNWYDVILKFIDYLTVNKKVITVTIERDTSATGDRKVYVDHMSLSDFLMQKPIVIESIRKCGTIPREARHEEKHFKTINKLYK